MSQLDLYDLEKSKVGILEVAPSVFEAPIKRHLLHKVVNWQLAKNRSGTASTKTRGEVSGGGSKPWRQKHTGRARHGSNRSPIWRKGGVVFGPKPKDWSYNINKKIRRQALISALSLKYSDRELIALSGFDLPEIKTKRIADFVTKFKLSSALIVISEDNQNLIKSSRNIRDIKILKVDGLNVYDVLRFENLVMTEDSLNKTQEALGS